MNYQDAIAALEAAKVTGDVGAIIAAAEAIAAAGAAPKPARKPRKVTAEAGPAWWNDAKTGKRSIRESISVEFAGSHAIRCNLVTDPGKPINLARAVRIAIAFWRAKEGDGQCPAIASVTRLETGETFPADVITELSAAWRAPVVHARIVEALADKRARLERRLASSRALLAFRMAERKREVAFYCQRWHQSEGSERESAETLALRALKQGGCDVRSMRRDVANCLRWLAEIDAPAMVAAPASAPIEAALNAWTDEDAAALDAEPCEPAYPDVTESLSTSTEGMEPVTESLGPSVGAPPSPVRAPAKRARKPRAAKPRRACLDARDEAGALALPRSEAEWRALSSRLRTLHRALPKREQGCTTLCVGPDPKRQIRYAGYPGVSIYNGASPIGDLLHMAWLRRRHVEGDYGSRLAEARQFAKRSREGGAVPLPDAGRPYLVKPRIRVKAWSRPHATCTAAAPLPILLNTRPTGAQSPFARLLAKVAADADREAWASHLERMTDGLPACEWDAVLGETIETAERRGAMSPETAAYLREFYDLPDGAIGAPRKPLARTIVVADPPIAMPAFMLPSGNVRAFQRRSAT